MSVQELEITWIMGVAEVNGHAYSQLQAFRHFLWPEVQYDSHVHATAPCSACALIQAHPCIHPEYCHCDITKFSMSL